MSIANRHLDVTALGVAVRFDFAADVTVDFERDVRRAWTSATVHDVTPDRTIEISNVNDAGRRLETLSVQTTLEALDHQRGSLIMFHAAGVATDDGKVAAFVGPSGRGKTTLSRALGARYGYVSDETIAVDADLRVYPYRKPLSVVQEGAPKLQVSPAEAGLRDLPDADLRLSALILIGRDASVVEPVVEPMPFVDAIQLLVPQLSYLPDLPNPLQRLTDLCDSVGGVHRLQYSEAAQVPDFVATIMNRTVVAVQWEPCTESVDGPFGTGHVLDAIRVDDHVIVLVNASLQILDGIAPAIWDAARGGRDREGIIADVVEIFGQPEGADAAALTDAALSDLILAGVLTQRE